MASVRTASPLAVSANPAAKARLTRCEGYRLTVCNRKARLVVRDERISERAVYAAKQAGSVLEAHGVEVAKEGVDEV
jgi:hypothetical protein